MQLKAPNIAATPAPERLRQVQVLRALAALFVLIGHVQSNAVEFAGRTGVQFGKPINWPGGFGVDLFFMISGLIMVVSSYRLFGTKGAVTTFLVRRLQRIAPLYYLVTLVYLPIFLLGRNSQHHNDVMSIITSQLFVPYDAAGSGFANVYPVYSLGWTLNYEMFFYVLLAIALLFSPRAGLALLIGSLVSFVALGSIAGLGQPMLFWFQPIILEFGFGAVIGFLYVTRVWARLASHPAAKTAGVVAIVAGLALLFADPMSMTDLAKGAFTPNDFTRIVAWGIPAGLILTGALFWEVSPDGLLSRTFGRLGDASYSLYLVHPLCLVAIGQAVIFLVSRGIVGNTVALWSLFCLLAFAASIAASLVSYYRFERPVSRLFRQRPRSAVSTPAIRSTP